MIRKFWLENSLGNKFELTDKNFKYFLNAPNNLGFVKDISTISFGNVERIVGEKYQHINPTGELIFCNSNDGNYEDYYKYIQFIRYQPIKFYYLPPNTFNPYYQEGTIAQTDKSETSPTGEMRCPFYFKPVTHWLTSDFNELNLTSQMTGDGKTYPNSYPYHYSGNTLSEISLSNDGSLPVGFILEITGSTTDPQWSLYEENGNEYGKGKLNGTFDYVRIDSRDANEGIYLENGGSVIANPSSYQDLSIRISWRNTYVSV